MRPLEAGLPEAGSFSSLDAVGAWLADPSPSPYDLLLREERRQAVRVALVGLEPRLQCIIKMRYGFDDERPAPLVDVGKAIGLTKERVRQLQVEALEQLRQSVGKGVEMPSNRRKRCRATRPTLRR